MSHKTILTDCGGVGKVREDKVYRGLQGGGLFDLHTVLEGSCPSVIDRSIFVVIDPRTLFLPVLVGSFRPSLTIVVVTDPRTVFYSVLEFPLWVTRHCSREWNIGEFLVVDFSSFNQVLELDRLPQCE